MEICNDIIQGGPEWFALRELRMTASHGNTIQANGKGLETYIIKKMYEHFSKGDPVRFSNYHTSRGNNLEDIAGKTYALDTGYSIQKIGFVIHDDYVGCSPDLFVNDNGMAQIKCPDDKGYYEILRTGNVDKKYVDQCQMEMLVCKKEWSDLVFYNKNFEVPLFKKRIVPNRQMYDSLEIGFCAGVKLMNDETNKYKRIKYLYQKGET